MKQIRSISLWISQHGWLMAGMTVIILGSLAYLPLISKLGIYRDDWDIIFGGQTWGSQIFKEMFSIDRPFIGIQFNFIYQILGGQVLSWHLAAFSYRLISALLFLLLLRRLWSTRPMPALVMSSLFVVYPGFLQQADAITYTTHLIVLIFILLSLLFSVLAIQSKSVLLKALYFVFALLTSAYYLLVLEYVIGIEGLRIALIIYLLVVRRQDLPSSRKWKDVLLAYAPFALGLVFFVIWRFVFFQSERPAVDAGVLLGQYAASPFYKLVSVAITTLQDMLEIAFSSWYVPFYNLSSDVRLKQLIFSLGVGLVAAVIMGIFLLLGNHPKKHLPDKNLDEKWSDHAIWIGAAGLFASIFPVVVSGREVLFESILTMAFDRYSIHAAPGAIFFLGGILFTALNRRWLNVTVLVMVGMAVTTQLNASTSFANAWEGTRQLWWQMSWRAPQIQPGTMLLISFPADNVITEEYHVSYPANLVYYPESKFVQIGSAPLVEVTTEKVITGINEEITRRKVPIQSNFDQSLVAYFPTITSCLHLVDGKLPLIPPGSDPLVQLVAPYSHLEQVEVDAELHIPTAAVFGPEPARTWCYYYQSASLAAQKGDWNQVIALEQKALAADYKPVDPSEWLPFMYAYVNLKNYDNAIRIISYFKENDFLQFQACSNLEREESTRQVETAEGQEFLRTNLCQW